MRDDLVYLRHILDAIEAVESHSAVSQEEFMSSRLRQDASIRCLEIIGEAVKNLSANFRDQHPATQWKRIAGLRDVLIHGYFGVNMNAVWVVLKNDLPPLKTVIRGLIADHETPDK